MKDRKLQIRRRDRRTERQRVGVRPRALLGARTKRHGGHSPAGHGLGGPVPAASLSCSRPRCALAGGRQPRVLGSGVPRSLGPARARIEWSRRFSGRSGQARSPGPRRTGFQPDRALSPQPRAFTCATARRRGRRRPLVRARDHFALPTGSLKGGQGARVDLGWAGRPPNRGNRGLSSLSDY